MFCSSHHTSVSRPYVALRVDNLYSRDITTHGEQNEPPDRSTKRSHYTLLEHNATQHTESRRLNARNRTTHDTAAATPNQHKGVNSNTRLTQGGQHQGHGASYSDLRLSCVTTLPIIPLSFQLQLPYLTQIKSTLSVIQV